MGACSGGDLAQPAGGGGFSETARVHVDHLMFVVAALGVPPIREFALGPIPTWESKPKIR